MDIKSTGKEKEERERGREGEQYRERSMNPCSLGNRVNRVQ